MGFDVNRFQGDVDEELVCPICSGVLEDPVQVGRVFDPRKHLRDPLCISPNLHYLLCAFLYEELRGIRKRRGIFKFSKRQDRGEARIFASFNPRTPHLDSSRRKREVDEATYKILT